MVSCTFLRSPFHSHLCRCQPSSFTHLFTRHSGISALWRTAAALQAKKWRAVLGLQTVHGFTVPRTTVQFGVIRSPGLSRLEAVAPTLLPQGSCDVRLFLNTSRPPAPLPPMPLLVSWAWTHFLACVFQDLGQVTLTPGPDFYIKVKSSFEPPVCFFTLLLIDLRHHNEVILYYFPLLQHE